MTKAVLVVAQTPPPFHGQAIMTQYFLEGEFTRMQLIHVRMAFSEELSEVGRPGIGKALHLASLLVRIVSARLRYGKMALYYPPAGPNMVPFLRDCILLVATRWMFSRTIFHFHASGLSRLEKNLPAPLKHCFRKAYGRPDLAISISEDGRHEGENLDAKKVILVPNGIPDQFSRVKQASSFPHPPTIVFVGMITEEKGVGVLIEACRILQARGISFQCRLAGKAPSQEEFAALRRRAAELPIEFVGQVTDDTKWEFFGQGDVFCFPSYYASESFGLVVVEAMMCSLPVVVSDWRALPEIVEDGTTGLVVPVRDIQATADALEKLLLSEVLRTRMGQAGRSRYKERYTVENFRSRMEDAIAACL